MKKNEYISILIRNMKSGDGYVEHVEKLFLSQSVIKLPMLLAILDQVSVGELQSRWITLKESDKVPGCGVLKELEVGMEFTLFNLCTLMISISDNTATNMLIDYFGLPWYRSIFSKFGLRDTQLNRKLFDEEKQASGVENYFSCEEISLLLERIFVSTYTKRLDAFARASEFLYKQQINHKLSTDLFDAGKVAHKTGESNRITHDVGVVFSSTPYTFVFAAENVDVEETEEYYRFLSRGMAKGRF